MHSWIIQQLQLQSVSALDRKVFMTFLMQQNYAKWLMLWNRNKSNSMDINIYVDVLTNDYNFLAETVVPKTFSLQQGHGFMIKALFTDPVSTDSPEKHLCWDTQHEQKVQCIKSGSKLLIFFIFFSWTHALTVFLYCSCFLLLKENPHKDKNNDKEAFKYLNIWHITPSPCPILKIH